VLEKGSTTPLQCRLVLPHPAAFTASEDEPVR